MSKNQISLLYFALMNVALGLFLGVLGYIDSLKFFDFVVIGLSLVGIVLCVFYDWAVYKKGVVVGSF